MNRPSMTHTGGSNINRSSGITPIERIQPSFCMPSPTAPILKNGRGSRENIRSLWQKISTKKQLPDDSKKISQEQEQPQLQQCVPKKGCLKVLTQEESLQSCSSATASGEQNKHVRRRLTSLTDDDISSSCSDDDDDLYGEWESTPIITEPTTISFGTINVHVFSSTPTSDADVKDRTTVSTEETRKQAGQTNASISVDEYEMKRPSSKRKVLCKKQDEFVVPSSRKSGKNLGVLDWRNIRRGTVGLT
eukprot:CAMPEP_0185734260 /NCGR_PEP_ID=MMETSP1171-20130828/21943_1 /TAXON_ID=374046 /ORGANISM="Helicotheca tamensis, Strain CCMP826" /LENGTH=247 /DNA_ID=CAMNT_0028404211 /DNA_START=23 /DNA_END=763 /DNA_ORIENTATION=-